MMAREMKTIECKNVNSEYSINNTFSDLLRKKLISDTETNTTVTMVVVKVVLKTPYLAIIEA
jgi:hypothetical protein